MDNKEEIRVVYMQTSERKYKRVILWRDVEEKAEVAVDEIAESVARARLLLEAAVPASGGDSLRGRLARAFVALGTRIDREAARELATAQGRPV